MPPYGQPSCVTCVVIYRCHLGIRKLSPCPRAAWNQQRSQTRPHHTLSSLTRSRRLVQALEDPPAFLEGCFNSLDDSAVVSTASMMVTYALQKAGAPENLLPPAGGGDGQAALARAIGEKILKGELDAAVVGDILTLLGPWPLPPGHCGQSHRFPFCLQTRSLPGIHVCGQ